MSVSVSVFVSVSMNNGGQWRRAAQRLFIESDIKWRHEHGDR